MIAEIGEAHIVELEIAATRIRERADRIGSGLAHVGVIGADVLVAVIFEHAAAAAIVEHAGRGDRHLGRDLRGLFQKPEMVKHRMVLVEPDLAHDMHVPGDRLRALELDAGAIGAPFDAIELVEEIVVPERAAEFAVGHGFKSDIFLMAHERRDLAILDPAQFIGRDLVRPEMRARIF